MRIASVVALLLAIAGTAGRGQIPVALAGETGSSPASAPADPPTAANRLAVSPDYVIGPGDVLQISVWQEPQFGETVEVRPDGKISLPLVSDVKVSGLTPNGAQLKITYMLQGFVKHPLVSVVVAEVHSRVVYVIGEVQHPGPYPMFGPINVEQLIARAGGATRRAKKKHVYVLRPGDNSKIPVNYQKILEGNRKALTQNVELNPGDTVIVP